MTAGEEPVGYQNWYKEASGQPAQALPKEAVGPHLPPAVLPSMLPQLHELFVCLNVFATKLQHVRQI